MTSYPTRAAARLEEISLIFLAFVFPLAVYFLGLALMNRSRHPVMISGTSDAAGVLFAASGFLLLGGPAILTGIYEEWRLAWLVGRTHAVHELGNNWYFWLSLWFVYFLAVVALSVFVLWKRRNWTSIYNVDPPVFDELLMPLLDRLGLYTTRPAINQIIIRSREPLIEAKSKAFLQTAQGMHRVPAADPLLAREPARQTGKAYDADRHDDPVTAWAVLDLVPFDAMRHVSLHWSGGSLAMIRLEVETELGRVLPEVRTRDNPVGGWFMSLAISLFFLLFFGLLGILLLRILERLH